MKKKIRSVVVEGRRFNWRLSTGGDKYLFLRVWMDGNRLPWLEIRCPYRNPWLSAQVPIAESDNCEEYIKHITPVTVCSIIGEAVSALGMPSAEAAGTHHGDWDESLQKLSLADVDRD